MRSHTLSTIGSVLLLAVAGGGCGSDDSAKPSGSKSTKDDGNAAARALFEQSCGGCHALADANTQGSVGPRLDDTVLDAEAIAAQIERGGGSMPAGLLEGDDREAVARYVAQAASAK